MTANHYNQKGSCFLLRQLNWKRAPDLWKHRKNGNPLQSSYRDCKFESYCFHQIGRFRVRATGGAPLWPVSQAVKTPLFHGGNMGPTPIQVTTRPRFCFVLRQRAMHNVGLFLRHFRLQRLCSQGFRYLSRIINARVTDT